jgi:hypothetical protein
MARRLFDRARGPKEYWLVEGAKHNQALQVAGEEYRRRVLAFFNTHLNHTGNMPESEHPHAEPANVPSASITVS